MLSGRAKGSVVLQPVIVSFGKTERGTETDLRTFSLSKPLPSRFACCRTLYRVKHFSWNLKSIDAAPQGFMYQNAETLYPTNVKFVNHSLYQ